MNLSLATRPGRGCVVVQLGGELDLATDPDLRQGLQQVLQDGARVVVLDLTDVAFLDSTALGTIVWLHEQLQPRNGHVRVAVTRPLVLRVMELTSVDRLVRIYDTVAAAEADLAA
ncbi:STAS domain-containing protein [Catellatospora methionotrophica]|uniref:STAS domain-containing protein n=1 Tax=Catellatospora methionotrophica TaxID=121620 RepID=UPI00340C28D9